MDTFIFPQRDAGGVREFVREKEEAPQEVNKDFRLVLAPRRNRILILRIEGTLSTKGR